MPTCRLLLLVAALRGAPLLSAPELPAASQPPLNILWILAEDLSPHLGCYGTREVSTPQLDRFAAEGVRFARAFATAPVCSASRSAMMTGMYQTTIGAHHHRSHRTREFPLPDGVRPITAWMRDAGYFTANIVHFPAPLSFTGTGKTDWNFYQPTPPFASQAWRELKSHQPFYAQINLSETHRQAQSTMKTGRAFAAPRRLDPAKVEIPPYYPDCPEVRADWANYLDDIGELDRKVGAILALLERDGLADHTLVIFLGDQGQAHLRGKQWCYDSGLQIPLLMRWPRGRPVPAGFRPGTVVEQIVEAIDLTPTCLALAGVAKPSAMQGRILFGPQAEAPRTYAFGARDRCDETVFRLRTVRDARYRYIRNFTSDRPFLALNRYKENQYVALAALRREQALGKLNDLQARLFAPHLESEELYDTATDPHETINLIASSQPEHVAARTRLHAALTQWLADTNDQGRFAESPEALARYDDEAEAWSRQTFHRRFNDKPDSALPPPRRSASGAAP